MKKKYEGITVEVIAIEGYTLMVGSEVKIRAKKSNTKWQDVNQDVEDMSGFTNSDW